MIVREIPQIVHGMDQKIVFTCSTGDAQTSSAMNGRVVDRNQLGRGYQVAAPFLVGYTTWGSTAADRLITVAMKLQHGTSSAGGDMADYSTGQQPATKNFFTTAQTTPMQSWSTGVQQIWASGAYDLRGANRFVRAVATVTNDVTSTSTAAPAETLKVQTGIAFLSGDEQPGQTEGGVGSTSTSTST